MAITHKFVSAKADCTDNTIVRPSDWNEVHEIAEVLGTSATFLTGSFGAIISTTASITNASFGTGIFTNATIINASFGTVISTSASVVNASFSTLISTRATFTTNATFFTATFDDGVGRVVACAPPGYGTLYVIGTERIDSGDLWLSDNPAKLYLGNDGLSNPYAAISHDMTDLIIDAKNAGGVHGISFESDYFKVDTGTFDFNDDNLVTTGRITGATVSCTAASIVNASFGTVISTSASIANASFGTVKSTTASVTNASLSTVKSTTATFGGTENYSALDATGFLSMGGYACSWDDSMVPSNTFRSPSSDITMRAYNGNIYAPRFDMTDEAHIIIQFPHSVKATADIYPHLHLSASPYIGYTNYSVGFKLEYAWGNIGASGLHATSSVTASVSFYDASAHTHKLLDFGAITPTTTQGGISSIFMGVLTRTTPVTEPHTTDDIFTLGFDIHFKKDTIGSRDVAEK